MSRNFVDVLRHRAADQPDREAFTFLGEDASETRCTYAELDAGAQAIAARLRESGNGHVALLFPPGRHFVEAFFGCLYAGRVAVPVYPPDLINAERALVRLRHVFMDAHPTTIATTNEVRELLFKYEPRLSEMTGLHWLTTDDIDASDTSWNEPDIAQHDVAMLQYTSGSTFAPRGVMLTHDNLMANSEFIKRAFAHDSESQGVIWLPPYHDMGLIGGILQPVYSGFPCALMSPMDFLQRPIRWLRAISRFRATTSGGPNFAYQLCARWQNLRGHRGDCDGLDLSSWRVAFNGAEPIHAATLENFTKTFSQYGFRPESFLACYGLAESTLAVTCAPSSVEAKIGLFDTQALEQGMLQPPVDQTFKTSQLVSCGRPQEDHEVLIVNPNTQLVCPEGLVGEIWVRGPSVAKGYWNKPAETEVTFSATLDGGTCGSFMRTGDLGTFISGDLYVTGRLKDLMIIQGRNHYPHDIEETAAACHDDLRPNCGAAFTVPGENGEALIIVQEVRRATGLDTDALIGKIRGAVARQHQVQVQGIALLPPRTLPKTSSGKIQRQLCRSLYQENKFDAVATWSLRVPVAAETSATETST